MKALRTVGTAVIVSALLSATAFAKEKQSARNSASDMPAVMAGAGAASMATVEAVDMSLARSHVARSDGNSEFHRR